MTFKYTALNSLGAETKGLVKAYSKIDAISQLRNSGLYPTRVVEDAGQDKEESSDPKEPKQKKIRKLTIMERILGKVEL